MDGGDALATTAAPVTWHHFLERMRHPSAADFVKSIKSFVESFSRRDPDPEKDSTAVQEFLTRMEGAFRAHTLWAGSSEEELESVSEGLEKFVMTKLYNRAFTSLPEEVKHDDQLYEKISLVQQFIQPEHLDINPTFQNETSWLYIRQAFKENKLAQKELQKINMYKAPRDKFACILSCCKVINNLLLNALNTSHGNHPGADAFLPILIYVTIKANPPQLHSNLLYIQRYRSQSRLVSEAAYFFTNILSAESFIWNIDAHSLSIDETEFQRKMESARAHLLGLSSSSGSHEKQRNQEVTKYKPHKYNDKTGAGNYVIEQTAPSQAYKLTKDVNSKDHQISDRLSILDLENKGATVLSEEDQLSRYFQQYPFLYACAGDLTVEDVGNLLNSYKLLVFKYVSLAKGMDITSTSLHATLVKTEINDEAKISAEMDKKYEGLGKTGNSYIDTVFSSSDDKTSRLPTDDSLSYTNTETGKLLD